LSYNDWDKIGCVNHDCDQCKAVQEPVAWRYDLKRNGSFAGVSTEYSPIKLSIGENWTPLYTTPPAAQPAVPLTDEDRSRVLFERHWRKTRGPKKSDRELTRHRLQPQTYIQDSANRHWVTWQAALKTAPPAAHPAPVQHDECVVCGDKVRVIPRPWVGLTETEVEAYDSWADFQVGCGRQTLFDMVRDIEAKLKEKNHDQ
jgi:hypothetical protein